MSRFTQDFSLLVGQVVRQWVGTELAVDQHAMAFASGEWGMHALPPYFWRQSMHTPYCLQLWDLELQLQDHTTRLVSKLDEDGNWFGLYAQAHADQLVPWPAEDGDCLRVRVLDDLPCGSILAVDCDTDAHGQTTAVALQFSSGTVKLSCGEMIREDGRLTVIKPQEFLILETVGRVAPN